MKKISRRFLTFFFLLVFFFSVPAGTQAVESSSPPDNWWRKSALSPDALYPGLLKRFNADISGSHLTGNTSGWNVSANTNLTLRKNRFTTFLGYNYARKDLKEGADNVYSLYQGFHLEEQFDLTRYFFLSAAAVLEEDTRNDIDERRIWIAGLGSRLLSKPSVNCEVFLGTCRIDEEYSDEVLFYTALEERRYNNLFVYQQIEWDVRPWLKLRQGLRWIHSFSRMGEYGFQEETSTAYLSDKKEREMIRGMLEIEIPVHSALRLFLSYQALYDSHVWPGNEEMNSNTKVGLRLTF